MNNEQIQPLGIHVSLMESRLLLPLNAVFIPITINTFFFVAALPATVELPFEFPKFPIFRGFLLDGSSSRSLATEESKDLKAKYTET